LGSTHFCIKAKTGGNKANTALTKRVTKNRDHGY
jgi:hypothetical protein